MCEGPSWLCPSGRISIQEEEARQQRQALSKAEMEKRQLQDKLTDFEKVKLKMATNVFFYFLWTVQSSLVCKPFLIYWQKILSSVKSMSQL